MEGEKMDFRKWQKDNLPKEEINEIYNKKKESPEKSTGENQPEKNSEELERLKNRLVEIDLELEEEQKSEKLTELSRGRNEVEKKIKELEKLEKVENANEQIARAGGFDELKTVLEENKDTLKIEEGAFNLLMENIDKLVEGGGERENFEYFPEFIRGKVEKLAIKLREELKKRQKDLTVDGEVKSEEPVVVEEMEELPEEIEETDIISLAEELGVRLKEDFRNDILRLERIKNGEEEIDASFVRKFHEDYLVSDDYVSVNRKEIKEKTWGLYEDVNRTLEEDGKGRETAELEEETVAEEVNEGKIEDKAMEAASKGAALKAAVDEDIKKTTEEQIKDIPNAEALKDSWGKKKEKPNLRSEEDEQGQEQFVETEGEPDTLGGEVERLKVEAVEGLIMDGWMKNEEEIGKLKKEEIKLKEEKENAADDSEKKQIETLIKNNENEQVKVVTGEALGNMEMGAGEVFKVYLDRKKGKMTKEEELEYLERKKRHIESLSDSIDIFTKLKGREIDKKIVSMPTEKREAFGKWNWKKLFYEKVPVAAETEIPVPSSSEPEAEPEKIDPGVGFETAFEGGREVETPKKGWVYRNLSHRGEWNREKEIGRVKERIDGVEILSGLLIIARDCAKESKFSKEINNFFKEFENYLASWSRGENSVDYQREEDFAKLAVELRELEDSNNVNRESLAMASAFFDRARDICLGVESTSIETPLPVEDIDETAPEISVGEGVEGENEKEKDIKEMSDEELEKLVGAFLEKDKLNLEKVKSPDGLKNLLGSLNKEIENLEKEQPVSDELIYESGLQEIKWKIEKNHFTWYFKESELTGATPEIIKEAFTEDKKLAERFKSESLKSYYLKILEKIKELCGKSLETKTPAGEGVESGNENKQLNQRSIIENLLNLMEDDEKEKIKVELEKASMELLEMKLLKLADYAPDLGKVINEKIEKAKGNLSSDELNTFEKVLEKISLWDIRKIIEQRDIERGNNT